MRRGSITWSASTYPPRSIAFARALYDRPSFETCNLPGQTLPEGPFDLVTAFDVVEHFPSQARAAVFERIGAALADGGVLAVNIPSKLFSLRNPEDSQQVIDEAVGADEIVALAATQGLEPLSLERVRARSREPVRLLRIQPNV